MFYSLDDGDDGAGTLETYHKTCSPARHFSAKPSIFCAVDGTKCRTWRAGKMKNAV
jgi:hypothetical protein